MFTKDETEYPYMWYGLYQAGKNANVSGNGTYVQTAMIYGVLYDQAMQFIRDQKTANNTTYDVDNATSSWHTGSLNPGETGDVALNIWDLESNAYEWTQEALTNDSSRFYRGGFCMADYSASSRFSGKAALVFNPFFSTRLALYIE